MRLRRTGVTLVAVIAVALSGCAHPATKGNAPTPPLPTRGPTDATMQALLQGPLESDGRCFWVGASDGNISVIWPNGYTARTAPLRVLDDKSRLVGRVGDTVRLGGGEVPLTAAILAMVSPGSNRRCLASSGVRHGSKAIVWLM